MTAIPRYDTLRLILGDQLNPRHSWYRSKQPNILYVIAELHQEAYYVQHHIQKLCAFFLAMEQFAQGLRAAGHHVCYLTLDDTQQYSDLTELLAALCQRHQTTTLEYQQPDEYRLHQQLQTLTLPAPVSVQKVDSEHFYIPFDQLCTYFTPGKHQKMEFFYRKMRRQHSILMDGEQPLGNQWNFDHDNRKKLTPNDIAQLPEPLLFNCDTDAVLARINRHRIPYIGQPTTQLATPTNRKQAQLLLAFFCQYCLPFFGKFQDAMTCATQQSWSLYHSRLSFALNAKLISPQGVIQSAIAAYQDNSEISLAQVEGFVRQILGWREFVRGVYWANMPNYKALSTLSAHRKLPRFFWTGNTAMRCMSEAITQSLEYAYAHHIQRLMVTGNFCLLAGISPDEVDGWYLGIYQDAIEWVELPNTRGMSQFADGGLMATKPYAASGNYINKMSDYCRHCQYDVKQKTGPTACPLNSLYWHFLAQNKAQLQHNHRMSMAYRLWDKQGSEQRHAVLQRANWCLDNIESL